MEKENLVTAISDKMGRKDITSYLSQLVEEKIDPYHDPRIYWAKEVTFAPPELPPNCVIIRKNGGRDVMPLSHIRVDYMMFKPMNNTVSGIEKGNFYCYEVKSCENDFHSGHGLNFIGDFNYLVMPSHVYYSVKDEIPWGVGVLCPTEENRLMSMVKARRMNRTRPVSEMLLMMFRSVARERYKTQKEDQPDVEK